MTAQLAKRLDRLEITSVQNTGNPLHPLSGTAPQDELALYRNANPQSGTVQVRTTYYRNTCRPWCSCRCHVRGDINSPRFAKQWMGSWSIGYGGISLLTRKCNEKQCHQRSGFRLTANYQFPRWIWSKALHMTLNTMAGPELLLRVRGIVEIGSVAFRYCIHGNSRSLKRLLDKKEVSPYDSDTDGDSLLTTAFRMRQYDTCRLLISYGADVLDEDGTGTSCFDQAWDWATIAGEKMQVGGPLSDLFPQSYDSLDERQFSRLHKIILGLTPGSTLEHELAQSTATINDPDNVGRTPLFWAAAHGDLEAVTLLLKYGADSNVATTKPVIGAGAPYAGKTCLHVAASRGHSQVVSLLLANGAVVDSKDVTGRTPLYDAPSIECVELLIDHGADVHVQDLYGMSPFMNSIFNKYEFDIVQMLLDYGADINHKSRRGRTALDYAVKENYHAGLWILLRNGADHASVTCKGSTLLHSAANWGDIDTLQLLAEAQLKGIDPNARDGYGWTAEECADTYCAHEEPEWHETFRDLLESITQLRHDERLPRFDMDWEEILDTRYEELWSRRSGADSRIVEVSDNPDECGSDEDHYQDGDGDSDEGGPLEDAPETQVPVDALEHPATSGAVSGSSVTASVV